MKKGIVISLIALILGLCCMYIYHFMATRGVEYTHEEFIRYSKPPPVDYKIDLETIHSRRYYHLLDEVPPHLLIPEPIPVLKKDIEFESLNFPSKIQYTTEISKTSFSNLFTPQFITRKNKLIKPAIIPLGMKQPNVDRRHRAYQHIFTNVKRYSSELVLYPYQFEAQRPDNGKMEQYPEGAIMSIRTNNIPDWMGLKTNSTIEFGRAKALYDNNIGVLRVVNSYMGKFMDLTYESDRFCEMFATYLGKYVECLSSDDYMKHRKNDPKSQFVYIDPEWITKDILMINPITPRFTALFIPDIILGAEGVIMQSLNSTVVEKIKEYINAGGMLYASGKGARLLEFMGILPKQTFDEKTVLFSRTTLSDVSGCEDAGQRDPYSTNYLDFVKSVLCFSLVRNKQNEQDTYILSPYWMNHHGGMQIITTFKWNENLQIKDAKSGLPTPIDPIRRENIPMILYKNYGKGRIVINQASPSFKIDHFPWIFNAVLLGMSKNFLMNTKIGYEDGESPIPGLEEGVVLDLEFEFFNLFDTHLQDFLLDIWVPNKVETIEMDPPHACYKFMNSTNLPPNDLKTLNRTFVWRCSFPRVEGFTRTLLKFTIEITDATVTQQRNNILMAYPQVSYINSRNGKYEYFEHGGLFVNALVAAVLRTSINPDPSSFYPIAGRGQYIDNVVPVENKEHTQGHDVEFIAMVPIVSPVVDISDQISTIHTVTFWDQYYKKSTNQKGDYPFPFRNPMIDSDFLDFNFLKGKGTVLGADWDTPVKNYKVVHDSSFPSGYRNISIDTKHANLTSTNTNSYVATQQLYLPNSDKFFEHATQRQLVFIDTSLPEGAKAFYNGYIPDGIRNPRSDPKAPKAKKELMWVRADIYFYETKEYTSPVNVNYTHVFSLDRYPNDYKGPCIPNFGDARAKIMVPGYFDDTKPNGLKPNEYSNELLMHCEKHKIDYHQAATFSGGSVKPARYLVPIKDDDIQEACDVMHFSEDKGELKDYPEVRFVKAHTMFFLLPPDITRKGGILEFQLPVGFIGNVDPVEQSLITFSADHVAFYKTTYNANSRIVKCYFKRGNLPDEQYGNPSQISINIEQLNSQSNFTISMKIYELKYDLSLKQANFERYIYRTTIQNELILDRFFSLPALEIRFKLRRGEQQSSIIQPYEYLEPMARFGIYYQELQAHRTIWGSAETHHVTDPGLTARNSGFSVISNIGISSIPFREYLTTGKSLMIPSASQTSRVEWKDLWGRNWAQPLRSPFVDVPPVPPPLRNFMMSSTFEVTHPVTGERLKEWSSHESVDVRVHIKLLNNYPKYFQITTCKENEVMFLESERDSIHHEGRIFSYGPFPKKQTDLPNGDYHLNLGNMAFYGFCFNSSQAIIQGKQITEPHIIANAYHCAANLITSINCSEALKNIPTISRRKDDSKTIWNWSPLVENYYPINYIKENMWDLTHYDYDDNAFDRAYKYHMDNNLPSIDNDLLKPHNIIAQPIWKGFGYKFEYSPNYSVKKFPQYKGWWSDNLQNKDHTLLAGQNISYDYSVDKDVINLDWIPIHELLNSTKGRVEKRLKNIYVCLFNRHRVRMHPKNPRVYYLGNVNQNNVVPIIPNLSSNDQRLRNYNCDLKKDQYTPENIGQLDNVLRTNSARDWIYFAANLRGNAKETINVVYKLVPLNDYEGETKVNDGGRFVYWNPANGPNSYLIVDNPVNVIQAKRSDISIEVELFPKATTTFKATVYQLISVEDKKEINREFRFPIWINHYGFGDSATSVNVGGILGTTCHIRPGQTTYAKITLYNNCGFDWNMYGKAIDFHYNGTKPINANDLLSRVKHAIQIPIRYNFFILDIPDEIKDYIIIEPSDHNADVAPLFFDFQTINVVTIRDGLKGDYFYKITLKDQIPDSTRGRIWEIKVSINETCFDRLPNYNSPLKPGYHDYKLEIPPIVIAIPNPSNMGQYSNKVYYTSGFSTYLQYSHKLPLGWEGHEAKFISSGKINELRRIASEKENIVARMQKFFDDLGNETIPYVKRPLTDGSTELQFNFIPYFPTFPLERTNLPSIASFYVLLKTTAEELSDGLQQQAVYDPTMSYIDHAKRQRNAKIPTPNYRTISAKGARLEVEYLGTIVDGETLKPLHDQRFFPEDEGLLEIVIRVTNTGSDVGYNVNLTVQLAPETEVDVSKLKTPYVLHKSPNITREGHKLELLTGLELGPRIAHAEPVYIRYSPANMISQTLLKYRKYNVEPPKETYRTFIKGVGASIDMTRTPNEIIVKQEINREFSVPYLMRERDRVSLYGKQKLDHRDLPIIELEARPYPNKTTTGHPVRFYFYKKIRSPLDNPFNTTINGTVIWVLFGNSTEPKIEDQTVPPREMNFTTWLVDYRVETVDENGQFLAESATLKFAYKYPIYYHWLIAIGLFPLFAFILFLIFIIVNYTNARKAIVNPIKKRLSIRPKVSKGKWFAEDFNTMHDRGHVLYWKKRYIPPNPSINVDDDETKLIGMEEQVDVHWNEKENHEATIIGFNDEINVEWNEE